MSDIRVARRYAAAVMELAEEQKEVDRLAEDLAMLRKLLRESREFVAFLRSTIVAGEKKKAILDELFGGRLTQLTMRLLALLVEKGREAALGAIIEEFFRLRDVKLGVVNVEVSAATDLTKEQRQKLEGWLEKLTEKKVRLDFNVDRQLISGFVARVGDTVFDGSVRRQLELLKERFTEEAIRN